MALIGMGVGTGGVWIVSPAIAFSVKRSRPSILFYGIASCLVAPQLAAAETDRVVRQTAADMVPVDELAFNLGECYYYSPLVFFCLYYLFLLVVGGCLHFALAPLRLGIQCCTFMIWDADT